MKPNLFIIGAAKAGTSALHEYLDAHPDVFMCRPKEPGYFAFDLANPKCCPAEPRTFSNDLTEYLKLFEHAPECRYWGDASTQYTQYPHLQGCAERICEFNPAAYIVYVLRDPVERTISDYWWQVRWEGETNDMYTAITSNQYYRDLSHYAMQLRPYFATFDRRRIKVLTAEALKNRPAEFLSELCDWLEVPSNFTAKSNGNRVNETPSVVVQPRMKLLHQLRHSRFWDRVGPLTPKLLRKAGARLSERHYHRKKVDLRPVKEFLRPIQRQQTEELCALLGQQYGEWKTLYSDD